MNIKSLLMKYKTKQKKNPGQINEIKGFKCPLAANVCLLT